VGEEEVGGGELAGTDLRSGGAQGKGKDARVCVRHFIPSRCNMSRGIDGEGSRIVGPHVPKKTCYIRPLFNIFLFSFSFFHHCEVTHTNNNLI
jgi:hypothetical protein